jgi:hypothetical protein
MALAKELKQQVTWRKRLTGGFLITDEAPSHKLATIGEYKKL